MAQMNLIIKQKQAHRLREGTYGYQQGRVSRGTDWEFGVDMYTLLYLKRIKDLYCLAQATWLNSL